MTDAPGAGGNGGNDAGAPGGSPPDRGAGESVTTDIPALLAGVRADRGVSMVANVSRAAAAQLIAAGRVLVDGAPVVAGRTPLREGATLSVLLAGARDSGVAPDSDVRFVVVHEDDLVAVVDKPAGLVVHPGAGHDSGTLVGGLLARFPDLAELVASGTCAPDRPGIVHRLDKGTSGLLAVARTPDAYRALAEQLAARTMGRRYLAMVAGLVAGGPRRGGGADRALLSDTDQDGDHRRGEAGPHRVHGHRATRWGNTDDPARALAPDGQDPSDTRPHGSHRPSRGG